MNAAISVMVCDGVFKGSAFLLGDDIRNRSVAAFHRTAALWGQRGLFLLVPFVEFMRYRFSCLKS